MKRLITFVCLVFVSGLCYASDSGGKPAELIVPAKVHVNEAIQGDVEFTWDEDQPLVLDTWSMKGGCLFGSMTVYEASGHEVPGVYPMSLPLLPDGKRTVRKGETVRMHLYTMGYTVIPGTGRYYAVAQFSGSMTSEYTVRFTTRKRWFEAIR